MDCALVVGNRLLVYVVDGDGGAVDEKGLALYVAEGKKERDETGLNQFRLVVAEERPAVRQRLQKAFEALDIADDRIHLHMISRKQNIFTG